MRIFTLCTALILATPLAAQDDVADLSWETYRYDAFEPSDLGLGLRFGLPESDFVVMRANCMSPGDGGGANIRGAFSAELGAAVEGQPLLIEFEGLTGGLPVVNGRASGVGAEIGITGAVIESRANDRLWQHLAAADTIRYRVRGQEDWTSFPGDPAQMAAFQMECGNLEPAGTPLPPPVVDCSGVGSLASTDTGAPLEIAIINQSDSPIQVFWIDPTAMPTEMGTVPPGQSAQLGTDAGHFWMIGDADGTCQSVHDSGRDIIISSATPARVDTK